MENDVNTFQIEEAFQITRRGWVLVGELEGEVATGSQLLFNNGVLLQVKAVEMISRVDKIGLFISNPFESREELSRRNIIGATAQILE